MEAIHFEVGAKAARLIGRENITDPDGALVELVKNAYDADASCVCVWFDMPFHFVPSEVELEKIRSVLSGEDQKKNLDFGNLLLVGINYDKDAKGTNAKKHSCVIEKI